MALQQFAAAAARAVQQVEAQAQRLALSRRAFCEGLAEAEALNAAQSGLYLIDVGGASFQTRTEVLHRHGGMLSAMASDDFSHDAEGGGYAFLDRDPTWFPLVLHFLRTGVPLLPRDTERRAALFREARYYGLEGLCREQLVVMGYSLQTHWYYCDMYRPVLGSWERMDVDMGALPVDCRFCAGDGCLFALAMPDDHRAGSVSRFCPGTGCWEPTASSVPDGLGDSSCVYHRGRIYGTSIDGVQSLDVSTGQWEALPPPSTERRHATPCVVDGRLFILGGNTASVEEYVAPERRWVSVPDMPRAVHWAAAVALDGKLLVIGGQNPDCQLLSAVVEYDPGGRSWRELPSMPQARRCCDVTVLGGDVVVMGGQTPRATKLVERYDRRSRCWEAVTSLPHLPLPFFGAAIAVRV